MFATLYLIEILHQTTTPALAQIFDFPLYLIEILHQTTTLDMLIMRMICCILLKFYIKPQLWGLTHRPGSRCILLKFYIKPQHFYASCCAFVVVSY